MHHDAMMKPRDGQTFEDETHQLRGMLHIRLIPLYCTLFLLLSILCQAKSHHVISQDEMADKLNGRKHHASMK